MDGWMSTSGKWTDGLLQQCTAVMTVPGRIMTLTSLIFLLASAAMAHLLGSLSSLTAVWLVVLGIEILSSLLSHYLYGPASAEYAVASKIRDARIELHKVLTYEKICKLSAR